MDTSICTPSPPFYYDSYRQTCWVQGQATFTIYSSFHTLFFFLDITVTISISLWCWVSIIAMYMLSRIVEWPNAWARHMLYIRSSHFADVTNENNEPQDFEPVVNLLADSTEAKNKEGNPATSTSHPQNIRGWCWVPTIPADIFTKIKLITMWSYQNSFRKKSRTQSSIQKEKKKARAIEKFTDWLLAFCTYSQALLSDNPHLGGDLLTFIGTVAWL